MENIAARLHYMEEAKEDVRADIAVMKRAAEKADSEVTKAELEKKKQVKCTVNKETNEQETQSHGLCLELDTVCEKEKLLRFKTKFYIKSFKENMKVLLLQ